MPLLAYYFKGNLYIVFVRSRLALVASPSFALMNPKYYHTMLLLAPDWS